MPITLQSVEVEYEKNPEMDRSKIEELAEWLVGQPHLPDVSELELILFYHSCEYDMELTKTTIDNYFTFRTRMTQFFSERDPTTEKNMLALKKSLYAFLPTTTKEGYKVIYSRILDTNPANFDYDDSSKGFSLVNDLWQREEGTFPGVIMVSDMEGVSFGFMRRVGISSLKDGFRYLQEALPVRLKGFHFLNTPYFMSFILRLIRPFMKKELYDMIHLHPAPIDTVYDYVPKEAFPSNMGGNFDSYDKIIDDTIKRLHDNRQFFLDQQERRVDETKRPNAK